jgi:aryl-alcohol dehydrogenase-like predicted oxidoreductase
MNMNRLGRTDIMVSDLCLGSMTWGTQSSEAEAHGQIDRALEAGINFVDTAEMYPVNPVSAETCGRTEEIIGTWNAKGGRDRMILATKHSGSGMKHVRDGEPISSKTISSTLEGSLKRLQTDNVDLYQFHWPNRGSYMFRQNWTYDPSGQNRADTLAHIEDTLGALQREVDKGRIRAFGLSNESAWGTAQWLAGAEGGQGPRVATIQNEYSLLCRMYDTDLAELSVNEDVGLLSFSPLAVGLLTGKYQEGAVPAGSRKELVPGLGGRASERVFKAVEAYLEIAADHGLDPVHMAIAWCRSRPFMASVIFGATRMSQLDHVIDGLDIRLSDEVLSQIDEAHRLHPMPY